MKRHVLIYGFIGGVLVTLLKWTEYRFLVIEHSVEIYGGLIAATFAILGIWLGLRLTRPQPKVVVKEVPIVKEVLVPERPFVLDDQKREQLGITRRELDVLELIAQGMSNREIAEKLYVSENTVKTHSQPGFRQAGSETPHAGRPTRKGSRSLSVGRSAKRMILLPLSQNHPKE